MIFLDTNVIVDLLRDRKPKLTERYIAEQVAGASLVISTVVLAELRFGARNSERVAQNLRALDIFLEDGIRIIPFDEAAAEEAGVIRAELSRAGTLIGPYDILIAAQARRHGAALVTANIREFERVPGLMVTDWAA